MKEEYVKAFQKAVKYCALALAIFLTVSIIGGIVGAFGYWFGIFSGESLGEMESFELSGDIRDIELEIGAAELKVTLGEEFSVRSNLEKLNVRVDNGVLKIEEKISLFSKNYNDALVEIVLPEDFSFRDAEIETGAGLVDIDSLSAQRLDLKLGAGKVVIDSLTVTSSAEIEGGAGELNIGGGSLHNLDFDMGVGECNVSSRMSGECRLNMGVGEANVTLIGSESDYKISFSTGIGGASFNGENVKNNQTIGNGSCLVDIDGGIGKLNVNVSAE